MQRNGYMKRNGRSGERPLRGGTQSARELRFLLPLGLAVLLLLFPAKASAGAVSGLGLAAGVLVPSLFPVGVLFGCLLRMGPERAAERLAGRVVRRWFGVPGAGAVPLCLGLLGGYPLGVLLVCSMYRAGSLSRRDALRLSTLCNNAGPAFLLGVAGTALGDLRLGVGLAVIQLLSVLLAGLLLGEPDMGGGTPPPLPAGETGFVDALLQSIRETALSMVTLAGTLCLFHAGLACLEAVLPLSALPPLLRALAKGSLELTGGISALVGIPAKAAFPLAALLIGWGGLCVHLQAAGLLRAVGLPVGLYLRGKALQGAICLLLAVIAADAARMRLSPNSLLAAFALLFLSFFSIFKKSRWNSSAYVL